MSAWGQRTNKYGNHEKSPCVLGHSHRSQLERAVCDILYYMMKAKELVSVEAEVRVKVCGPIGHDCMKKDQTELIVDFKATRPDGTCYYVEAKGDRTPVFAMKRRMWSHYSIGRLEIWEGSWQRPFLKEVIGE